MIPAERYNLDFYDENTDDQRNEEYYRICPEEKYEIYEEEDNSDDFEVPDVCPPSNTKNLTP